jgi:hypothetical protein
MFLLTMPVASATAEISFSVLRRLKTYVRLTMKNDRLSSLGLTIWDHMEKRLEKIFQETALYRGVAED